MTGAAPADGRDTSFRADIQGLRAIAVLSVVLYHADAGLLPGGFVGVDIFFVISGFLITGILLRELERGEMSIAGFYHRRVKRLFPALFVMLAAVLIAGAVVLAPSDFAELGRTAISTVFFVSNFDFYSLSGYFDGAAADKPLLHTWSLAVEEQFYIVFPLLLALLWRHARRHLALIMAAACVAGLAVSVWGALEHRTAAFYLTPFRAFELAMGALAAMLAPSLRLPQIARDALSLIGLGLIAASFVLFSANTPFPGMAAFVPCLGAALIIAAGVAGTSLGGRALSLPVLTFFGAISYSLYLWHWPALVFARHYSVEPPALWLNAILILFAIAAATASYAFVEQPILRRRTSRPWVFGLGAAGMASIAAVAGAILLSGGAPSRFSPQAQQMFASAEDYNHRRDECHGDEDHRIAYEANCVLGAAGAEPSAAVWGDSAGAELVVALGEAMARRGQAVMSITYSACPPGPDYHLPERPYCATHNRLTLQRLTHDARIRTVVIALNFARYPNEQQPQVYAAVTRSVEALRAAGKTVVLAYPFPNPWFESPRVLGLRLVRGEPLDTVGVPFAQYMADQGAAVAFLDALAARTGAVPFRMTDALCDGAFCHAYLPGSGVLYFNGNHISVAGARLAMTRFPFTALPAPSASAPAM
jgi:peptidoglycan/LPS O-acetylase OafA/YrhL